MRNKIRSALTIFSYLLSKSAVLNFTEYLKLARVLSPFRTARFISYRPYTFFLDPYISRSFSERQRYDVLLSHYAFLSKNIPIIYLTQFFSNGFDCLQLTLGGSVFKITLKKNLVKESEGPLSLLFTVDEDLISTMSFSFVPAHFFGSPAGIVLYISHLQRSETPTDSNEKFLSVFNKIHPSAVLLKAIESFCLALGIDQIAAVTASSQLSNDPAHTPLESFNNTYDAFWIARGGNFLNGSYLFNLPLNEIPILEIKQKHRNKTLKRRNLLNNISSMCLGNFEKIMLDDSLKFSAQED